MKFFNPIDRKYYVDFKNVQKYKKNSNNGEKWSILISVYETPDYFTKCKPGKNNELSLPGLITRISQGHPRFPPRFTRISLDNYWQVSPPLILVEFHPWQANIKGTVHIIIRDTIMMWHVRIELLLRYLPL